LQCDNEFIKACCFMCVLFNVGEMGGSLELIVVILFLCFIFCKVMENSLELVVIYCMFCLL
jgi:hypothetical protein